MTRAASQEIGNKAKSGLIMHILRPFPRALALPPITSPWVSKDPKDYCKVKAHLTTRWPRGTGELTKCLFKTGAIER